MSLEDLKKRIPDSWNAYSRGEIVDPVPFMKEIVATAYQQAFAEAVETERNRLKEWVRAQVDDNSGQCIHYEEILEALQDNK